MVVVVVSLQMKPTCTASFPGVLRLLSVVAVAVVALAAPAGAVVCVGDISNAACAGCHEIVGSYTISADYNGIDCNSLTVLNGSFFIQVCRLHTWTVGADDLLPTAGGWL